ncbi:MAG: DsbA family protein [Gammaproteobacteria bacterium]
MIVRKKLTGRLFLILSTLLLWMPALFAADGFTQRQKTEIQTIIREYLVANPEVLIEASQALRQKQQQAAIVKAQQAINQYRSQLFKSPTSPVGGNPRGNVVMVEFFDYQCKYCKSIAPVVRDLQQQDKNLRVVYKQFPIFGPESEYAARAALAAAKQGYFLAFHEALMQYNGRLTKKEVLQQAKKVGININKLQRDIASPQVAKELEENNSLAENLGLIGTPAFIVSKYPSRAGDESYFVPGVPKKELLQSFIRSAREK